MTNEQITEALRLLVSVMREMATIAHDHDYGEGAYISVELASDDWQRLVTLIDSAAASEPAE